MKKIAFLFAGQGAQAVGMGRDLAESLPVVRSVFDMGDRIRPGISDLCFAGDPEELKQTENTQPCLYLTDYAIAQALVTAGVVPAAAAGFSLGEIPALAFALGMFIPLELNVPLVVGGAINWYVTSRSKDAALNAERGEKGTLLASGFIAGGALMGVASAAMRFGGINLVNEAWLENPLSQVVTLVAYVLLIVYLVKASMNIKKS